MAPSVRNPLSTHRIVLVLLDVISTLLLMFAILGVPLIKTVALFELQLSIGIKSITETFQTRLGVLGFCHGIRFSECSPPGFPYRIFAGAISELDNIPIAKDAVQGVETALVGLALGFLLFFLIAGPLSFVTLVHDSFRPIPGLASKTSIGLSLLCGIFSIAGYIVTIAVFGTLGAAVKTAAALPDVEGSAGRGVGARLALAAGIIQFVVMVYKVDLIRRLRQSQSYGNQGEGYGMEMRQYY